ncbi:hypothetical protein L8X33_05520 [Campylobacter sp. CNRCH_2014_2849]|uniref:hypothetical protein n=1 Tax=Campylobacter sp. CNRCH_2014_2849 TaxID=2911604 RepID=UPI0021E6C73F|nr:hypothetical protein [Campylobacter sp. CNRCH_2014_2849]MCV3473835.1 hypothetical protein [Campylobacter sp. CNRCH_2014_2849]
MSIREFLKEKPRESDILAFLQQDNKDKNDYLDELRNDIDKAITQNRNNISIYNIQDQNLTNPFGHISQYKRDLYDYENNQEMNADDLSDYILDKQSQFNASKPIFADDNEVARKSNQFMKDLGDELQKSGRGKLLQDSDGSYWVKDVKGNYAKVQGSLIGDLYRGIRDNGASVALGTAGAIGGGMLGGGVGMVAGGALGASLGAGYDYYGNTKDTNQEANLKEALMLMGENAGLSLVGDAAFAGVAKGARALKNTYAMAKAGSAVGKDMIDGIALKGNNLKENIGDRFRSAMPTFVNDALSSGLDTTKNYVKEILDEKQTGLYNNLKNDTYLNPIEVNQGNVYADLLAKKAQNIADMSKNNLVKNISQKTADISTAISKNIGSKETALSHQELLNMSFMDNDLANVLAQNVKDNPQLANKLLNALSSSDKALLDELGISDDIGAKILYDLKESRAKRAYDEFGTGLDKLEKLNPNGVEIDKQIFRELADNAGVYSEATPTIVRSFLKRLDNGELDGKSVKQIYDEVSAISDKLKGEQSYNYKEFLNSVKDELLNSLVKNSSDPKLAKEILEKTRSDYAKFKKYYDSEIGKKLDGSEEDISKKLNKLINNTNDNKNYEAITKGLNPQEIAVIDEEFIKRNIAKYTKEFDGKKVLDYESFLESTKHFNPKSETGKIKMETLKAMGRLRKNMKPIYQSLATTKMEKQGKSIATTIDGRAMMMFINQFSDYIAFYFGRMFGLGKQAGMRIQYRRMVNNINNFQDFKTQTKEFINSIKDKYIKEQAQKLDAEFKAKVKDLIKGDNFYMDKPNPRYAKSDLNIKMSVSPNVRNLAKLTNDEIVADLEYLASKHKEMFKKPSDVFKLIKEIKENPTFFYKNNRMDIALIAKRLNDNKLGKLGINKDTGEVRHVTKVKEKDLTRLEKVSKKNTKENVGIIQTFIQPGSKNDNTLNGLPNIFNSTQDKPKENLIEKLKDNKNRQKKSIHDFFASKNGKKFDIFDLYTSKTDLLDIKRLQDKLEIFKAQKPKEINYKSIKKGYILDDLLNVDEDVVFAVVNKKDLKTSLTRSLNQFRNRHSNSTINNIREQFNEREHFKESSNFDGLPTITKDGLVIAGNHRSTAIKDLNGDNLNRYINQAKKVFGRDVFSGFDEKNAMIVRILDKSDDETIIRLSKLSNDGRLSDESEKLQALGAKYKDKLKNIEKAKINSDKELMLFLGSKDVLESKRALLDYMMPDISNALLAWERRSGGDSEFSRILNSNALNLLHLKQSLNENKILNNNEDFFSLFKRAIESMNQSNAYKSSSELYEILSKYAQPSLKLEDSFIPTHKDLQADILGFIIKYNDTLSNPSEAFEIKIKNAIEFINENNTHSLFEDVKLSNYDIINNMLNTNISNSVKYQEMLSKAIDTISKQTSNHKKSILVQLKEDKEARKEFMDKYTKKLKNNMKK